MFFSRVTCFTFSELYRVPLLPVPTVDFLDFLSHECAISRSDPLPDSPPSRFTCFLAIARAHTQDCQRAPPRSQARVGLLALCDPRQGCLGYVTKLRKSRCLKNAHAKTNPAPVAEN